MSTYYLLAKFGFDTVENEPCKVCPLSAYRSPRLNADLASFSDATKELGKEENQMKTDAAKFAADMDAATVNAGSFLQVKDRSEEGDRPPTSLVQI